MSALTSLLARDHAVPVKKIEEAIQRQVISGGELATALLEVGAASENAICAYVAAGYGLIPATRDEVMRAPRDVVRLVPREVADKHRLVPLAVEARTLVVAVIAPLSREDEQQLGFLLGMTLVPRIATEPRIAAGLQHHYDVAMPSRLRRLAEKLRSQDAGVVPIVAPLSDNRVDRAPEARASTPAGTAASYARPKVGANVARRDSDAPAEDAQDADRSVNVARVVGIRTGVSDVPPRRSDAGPDVAIPKPADVPVERVSVAAAKRANVAPGVEAAPESTRAPRSALLAGHTGPLSTDEAIRKLAESSSRDDVLHVAFHYLCQAFTFSALFLVHDDEADGIDVHGAGIGLDEVSRVTMRLDAPGTAKDVRDFLGARVSTLDATEADRELATALGRVDKQPSVVLPLVIRQRVVVLVYGDRGGKDFGLADLPDVLAFLPRVSEALQRLILKKKKSMPVHATALASKSWNEPSREEPVEEPEPAPAEASGPTVTFPATDASSVAATAALLGIDPSKGSQRPAAFDLLGVPRAAPPPPETPVEPADESPEPAPASREPAAASPTPTPRSEAPPAESSAEGEAPAAPGETASSAEDDEDGPELIVEDEPEPAPVVETRRPMESSTYHLSGVSEEVVVSPRRTTRQTARPGARPSSRPGASTVPARPSSHPPRRESVPPAGATSHEPGVAPSDAPLRHRSAHAARLNDRIPTPSAFPARRTPAPVENEASIITAIGTSVDALVDELCITGPDDLEQPLKRLLEVGESALSVLARRFPGPLWFDRHLPHQKLPRGRDVSAVARAMHAYRDRAVSHLLPLLESRDADVRFYATLLASELPHRDLVVPVGRRLFESEAATRALALDVLRGLRKFQREMHDVLDAVRIVAGNERTDVERRLSAIRILGELRDDRSAELLVDLLGDRVTGIPGQAHKSLVLVTRQDFGPDPAKWESWLVANRDRHRVEWLIDALLHPDEEFRRLASDELKHLTQEYFGYHPSAPKKERELTHRKYRKWWEQHGHQRFATLPP